LNGAQGDRSPLPEAQHLSSAAGDELDPYLLRGLAIERPNQVWTADITYIPMRRGFLYTNVRLS